VKNKKILETKILSVQELKKKREDDMLISSSLPTIGKIILPPDLTKLRELFVRKSSIF